MATLSPQLREVDAHVGSPGAAGQEWRYYELPTYDRWTDAFTIPGRQTSAG